MKAALRLMKGTLVEGTDEEENPTENVDHEEVNFSKTNDMRHSRTRSKSKPRFESRSFDQQYRPRSHSKGGSRERGRSTESRNYSEGNSYRRNRDSRSREHSRGRDYSRDRRRDYSRDRYNKGKDNKYSYENVNLIFKEVGEDADLIEKDNHD